MVLSRLDDALRRVDERISLKHVHRRLQLFAKLLITATFVEDAARILTSYSVQVSSMKIAKWEAEALQTALPIASFCIQTTGAILIVACSSGLLPVLGCYLLIGWCCWHPIMYNQVSFFQKDHNTNWEFVFETLTIQGGLLVLLSHFLLSAPEAKLDLPAGGSSAAQGGRLRARAHRLQALGRTLLVSIFLFVAGTKVHARVQRLELGRTTEEGVFDWVNAVFQGFVALTLLYLCSLVVIGMKSRWCALLLAMAMSVSAIYMHPFWLFLFSSRRFEMWGVSGMDGYKVDAHTMADHQRYFFFQTMSTVGALLLLVVHGPGALSIDGDSGGVSRKLLNVKGEV